MESKTQGSSWALQEPLPYPRTQKRILTIMDKGVIENFYHLTIMGECELDETNTFIVNYLSKP